MKLSVRWHLLVFQAGCQRACDGLSGGAPGRCAGRPEAAIPEADHGRRPEGLPSAEEPWVGTVTTPLKLRHCPVVPKHVLCQILCPTAVAVLKAETAVEQCPGGRAGVCAGLPRPMCVPWLLALCPQGRCCSERGLEQGRGCLTVGVPGRQARSVWSERITLWETDTLARPPRDLV